MSDVFDRVFVNSNDLQLLNHYLSSAVYSSEVNNLLKHTVFRIPLSGSVGNVDSFVIKTIANPFDTITYTSSANVVNLNEISDAGFF